MLLDSQDSQALAVHLVPLETVVCQVNLAHQVFQVPKVQLVFKDHLGQLVLVNLVHKDLQEPLDLPDSQAAQDSLVPPVRWDLQVHLAQGAATDKMNVEIKMEAASIGVWTPMTVITVHADKGSGL